MGPVTQILDAMEHGDEQAADQLLPLVYRELRRLAAAKLAQEKPGQTLQPTALVHEAYLRLVETPDRERAMPEGDGRMRWQGRGHFFAAAAEAMRRILVENARRKRSVKHGGGQRRVRLADAEPAYWDHADEVLTIDEALKKLSAEDPLSARLVELHYFAGLSITEAAELAGISRSTAYEHWAFARASLRAILGPEA